MDDQVTFARSLSRFFIRRKHSVQIAHSGKEGISMLDESLDLILIDYNMPGMNGYEFTVQVRKDDKYNHIPMVGIGDFPKDKREHLFGCRTKSESDQLDYLLSLDVLNK